MSWIEHHSKSEWFASEAQLALKSGDISKAEEYYNLAAQEETKALESLDKSKLRTLGITVVSAASLWFKAKQYQQLDRLAHKWLAFELLPDFAISDLQELLIFSWNEKAFKSSGVEFVKGEVLVSVSGGEIVVGAAPLDLIHRKVDEVRNLFYRTIEMLLDVPFRKKGAPSSDIQTQFRPWLMQAPMGSYQFAVRVQKPPQGELFPAYKPEVDEIVAKFFDIIEAAAFQSIENFEKVVPDPDYRIGFLKLTRNLAPTGKSFEQLGIKSAVESDIRPVVFSRTSRQNINEAIKKEKKVSEDSSKDLKPGQLKGVLRALHLDNDWIEVKVDDQDELVKVRETGAVIDDIVGPLVNQRVVVDVFIDPAGRYIFNDIQSED